MSVAVTKHYECGFHTINISARLRLDEITDDIVISMLDNVENRLLVIDSNYLLAIIRRINDSTIFKLLISSDD